MRVTRKRSCQLTVEKNLPERVDAYLFIKVGIRKNKSTHRIAEASHLVIKPLKSVYPFDQWLSFHWHLSLSGRTNQPLADDTVG